jgi:hypothetical protein
MASQWRHRSLYEQQCLLVYSGQLSVLFHRRWIPGLCLTGPSLVLPSRLRKTFQHFPYWSLTPLPRTYQGSANWPLVLMVPPQNTGCSTPACESKPRSAILSVISRPPLKLTSVTNGRFVSSPRREPPRLALIIIIIVTAVWLSPGSSGYFIRIYKIWIFTSKLIWRATLVSCSGNLGCWEPSQQSLIDRHRETKKNLCRDGRSQDLANADF